MRRSISATFVITLVLCFVPTWANGATKDIQVKLDYSKSAPQTMKCTGLSLPITYSVIPALAIGSAVNISIYNSKGYEQSLRIKLDSSGTLKNMSFGGRDWAGTYGGNPMPHEWYIWPIDSDPQEVCKEFKTDAAFAKAKYKAYKSIVALFIPRS